MAAIKQRCVTVPLKVVPAEHKPSAGYIDFELWEDGNPLPHTLRLNDDGTWNMTTEIVV